MRFCYSDRVNKNQSSMKLPFDFIQASFYGKGPPKLLHPLPPISRISRIKRSAQHATVIMIISGGFRMHHPGAAWRMLINIPVWGEKNYVSKRWMLRSTQPRYETDWFCGLLLLGCVFKSDWIGLKDAKKLSGELS